MSETRGRTAGAWCFLLPVSLLASCECYRTNDPNDAGTDATIEGLDAAFSHCRTPRGAFRCGSDDCPSEICWSCAIAALVPDAGIVEWYCYQGIGNDIGASACSLAAGCRASEGLCAMSSPSGGQCSLAAVCAELNVSPTAMDHCYYLDGTRFVTGEIPRTACPAEARGLACGPGCGRCADGFTCFGESEHSGIGHCGLEDQSPRRPACGTAAGTTLTCVAGRRCLQFVAPSEIEPFGSCLDPASCERLAEVMPERFRCE